MIIASIVAAVGLMTMGTVLYVQYQLTSVVATAVHDALSPAADAAGRIMLAQADAGGALSDYIMLERPSSLADYRASITRASGLLDEVKGALPEGETQLFALVAKARSAQQKWVSSDPEPVIALMEAGKRTRAMRATNSPQAWTSYHEMTAASSAMTGEVNRTRNEAAEAMRTVNSWLGATLVFVGLLILAGLVAVLFGLQRSVLRPLTSLRRDMQDATTLDGHETPIVAVGSPELQAVAMDAEALRRGLVREIDEARAAREGLMQDAPLVAAMERELAAPAEVLLADLDVFGTSQSAEGVMAGDWWDPIKGPNGTLIVVVADVSGHGPQATVTALRVRSILRSALLAGLGPAQAVQMAADSFTDDPHFVTGIVLVLDPAARHLRWVNAGHHPAIVVAHDKTTTLCEPTGPLISSLGGAWTTREQHFGPGDVVLAFTDGLVESRNTDGDELESAMVSQFIRGLDAPMRENPRELITRLLAQVRHRAADWRRDDVTLAAVAYRTTHATS